MPTSVLLTAVPAKYLRPRPDRRPLLLLKPLGAKLGLALVPVASINDIVAAVEEFGSGVKRRLPEFSFYITVRIRGGDVVPEGFDKAIRKNAIVR